MAQNLNLVNAVAGKRLVAGLLDIVPVVLAWMVFYAVNLSTLASREYLTTSDLISGMATSSMLLTVFVLAYAVAVWGWEAQTGKTPGNLALGLRTCDEDGFAPGWGKVFIRRLLVGLAGIVPVAGPVIMLLSNLWDPHHQRQGWHDKAARTLVVDVNQGRNPITTGGLFGPSAFAPGGTTAPGQPGHPAYNESAHRWPALAPELADGPITAIPGRETAAAPAPQPQPAAQEAAPAPAAPQPAPTTPGPSSSPAPTPTSSPAPAREGDAAQAEDDAGHTQLRTQTPAQAASGARLRFDDGQVLALASTALVGRNPAARDGEDVAELFNYADMGRSVSKTHLHLAADSSGVWVTDRNSTNGSGIAGPDGSRRPLVPGQSQHAGHGETVYFGDRYFTVGPA
ncbi:RDD family protein [Arthrobacter sp. JSM 101049]|uniref:RDD family protein n=1 Tax=Arthrobacter sp. JSM 101049 TaxID=929097 RepID=UPI003568EA96